MTSATIGSVQLLSRSSRKQIQHSNIPRLVDGGLHASPEDVGDLPTFEDSLNAAAKPRRAPHREVVELYVGHFEPDDISLDRINEQMAKFARRRHSEKPASQKARTIETDG